MILGVPGSIVNFCFQFLPTLSEYAPAHIAQMLPAVLAGIVSCAGSRLTLSAIARQVYGHVRHKSTISRMLECRDFRTRDLHWELARLALASLGTTLDGAVDWLLAIDGTSIVRGASTRIRGAIQRDKRQANKERRKANKKRANGKKVRTAKDAKRRREAKGRKTKYFTVLLGSLVTHFGVRIPLPRYTCDPKDFNRRSGRPKSKRETQLDLAKRMIQKLLSILPEQVQLVVLADSYFESEKLVNYARKLGFVFISPLDTNRRFASKNNPKKSNRRRIWNHGLGLPLSTFSRLDLIRGSEETASYRRYPERIAGPKDRRTYWHHHERRTVAKLGEVGIVCSWKTPVYEPKRNFRKKSFKILMCSNPDWSGAKVVEWYEMRWTCIEILIRELKQELGFEDYSGQSLQAMERYLDLVLMSFVYLEMRRFGILNDCETTIAERQMASSARTRGMKGLVGLEAQRQLLDAIRRSYDSPLQKGLLMAYLESESSVTEFHRPLT